MSEATMYGPQVQGLLDQVKAGLSEQGHTQAWLARRVGVTQKHVSLVLSGKAACSLKMLDLMLELTTTGGEVEEAVPDAAPSGDPLVAGVVKRLYGD